MTSNYNGNMSTKDRRRIWRKHNEIAVVMQEQNRGPAVQAYGATAPAR